MKKVKALPNIIYLERQNEGTEDEFLLVHESVSDVAVAGETIKIGTYALVNEAAVTTIPNFHVTKTSILGKNLNRTAQCPKK